MTNQLQSISLDLINFKNKGLSGLFDFTLDKNEKICFFLSNQRRFEAVRRYFLDKKKDIKIAHTKSDLEKNFNLFITNIYLPESFKFNDTYFISDDAFLGKIKFEKTTKKRNLEKLIKESQSFILGELVVHKDYGIGKFLSLERMEVSGFMHDLMKIEYKNQDFLYIPIENIDKISKYGQDSEGIILDSIRSTSWKERVGVLKKKIQDIAQDLIKLAATRKLVHGDIFEKSDLYQQFCNNFEYTETQDQMDAILDVEKDLSSGILMNRLICGDVGFGKTEVAMRAAFLVAQSKLIYAKTSQIAIIVPTTLLARQHFETFKKRFSNFDITIAKLSRMNTASQNSKIKKQLKGENIDIVIGTHSLLSKGVEFDNLKLLIIDEEQLFGVEQKEKLQKQYPNTHLLSMSATPIPRTMQMALNGIKDISVIATPPISRLAMTMGIVVEDDEIQIYKILKTELDRNGGVFIVTPHIKEINYLIKMITRICPEGKIISAHGQIKSDELDSLMNKFADKEYNILISTSIIASGIDMPQVNTIIIHKPQHFGISQLYQMRGRVGRSDKLAHCYFMLQSMQIMKNQSVNDRLSALLNINTLGAGFTIASFDLDIRGGGNILGTSQSGKIKDVGIEMYQDMLNEEIQNIKSGKVNEKIETSPAINISISALIPDDYILDIKTRINFYRRIGGIKNEDEISKLFIEMQDRFGVLPKSVENLKLIIEIKLLCIQYKISTLNCNDKEIYISISDGIILENIDKIIANKNITLLPNNKMKILVDIKNKTNIKTKLIEVFG